MVLGEYNKTPCHSKLSLITQNDAEEIIDCMKMSLKNLYHYPLFTYYPSICSIVFSLLSLAGCWGGCGSSVASCSLNNYSFLFIENNWVSHHSRSSHCKRPNYCLFLFCYRCTLTLVNYSVLIMLHIINTQLINLWQIYIITTYNKYLKLFV